MGAIGAEPESFWHKQAQKNLSWFSEWDSVCEQDDDYHFQWFRGGKLNASYNCLDRHISAGRGDKKAIIWEGENGEKQTISYRELLEDVCRFANVLLSLGVTNKDVVTIYLPLIPEMVIAVLACARIGAMHNVIFAGFSADSLAERNQNSQAKVIVTADGSLRKGKILPLKATVDQSLGKSPSVEKVIVCKRSNTKVYMEPRRDLWWHELIQHAGRDIEASPLASEHPLFLLYTSGSTGKPKGVLHTTAGYLLGATLSSRYVFDLNDEDVYWCTADVGWITGHSYVVYGPLSNGVTLFLYEGAPNFPHWGRFWEMIERYQVTKFYTAPTAIRAFMKAGAQWPKNTIFPHSNSWGLWANPSTLRLGCGIKSI